ncbi:hypothetical protein Tco_1039441, partial [Tanacetum coccineum]
MHRCLPLPKLEEAQPQSSSPPGTDVPDIKPSLLSNFTCNFLHTDSGNGYHLACTSCIQDLFFKVYGGFRVDLSCLPLLECPSDLLSTIHISKDAGPVQDVVNSCRTGATTNVIFSISVIFINVIFSYQLLLFTGIDPDVGTVQHIDSGSFALTSNRLTLYWR